MQQYSYDPEGIVFDIQRCSMHDGPGIRTTVFLKGCPLSCLWCHNPESQSPSPQLACYQERCACCGNCGSIHPEVHAFNIRYTPPHHKIFFDHCAQCGNCVDACPSSALKIFGKSMTVSALLELVEKDRHYYEQTNGGLTVSGGEPFSQPHFLLALIKRAKASNLSVCVETSGFVSQKVLEKALPYIDLFLYDYKETSPELHRRFTGADNTLILSNLSFLYAQNCRIFLRCPIIPGCNDTLEHFRGIAGLERRYSRLEGIEILPYHDFGRTKALAVGKDYSIASCCPDDTLKSQWKKIMARCGCSNRLIDSLR